MFPQPHLHHHGHQTASNSSKAVSAPVRTQVLMRLADQVLLIQQDLTLDSPELTQKSCLLALLARTGHEDSPGNFTPASPGIKLKVTWCPNPKTAEGKAEIARMKDRDYANRVGSANWLARGSKPETSWTAGILSRFLSNPGEEHWKMTDYLMQYFSRTRDRRLVFRLQTRPQRADLQSIRRWRLAD